jgi:hypothetical protein
MILSLSIEIYAYSTLQRFCQMATLDETNLRKDGLNLLKLKAGGL